MADLAPEYVAARRVLLDALTALTGHLDNLILVGAQAVYHHTGEGLLNVPLMTTDADLAINVDGLCDLLATLITTDPRPLSDLLGVSFDSVCRKVSE